MYMLRLLACALDLLFVYFKGVTSSYLRWQEFELDSWINTVKSSQDVIGLNHVSSFSFLMVI